MFAAFRDTGLFDFFKSWRLVNVNDARVVECRITTCCLLCNFHTSRSRGQCLHSDASSSIVLLRMARVTFLFKALGQLTFLRRNVPFTRPEIYYGIRKESRNSWCNYGQERKRLCITTLSWKTTFYVVVTHYKVLQSASIQELKCLQQVLPLLKKRRARQSWENVSENSKAGQNVGIMRNHLDYDVDCILDSLGNDEDTFVATGGAVQIPCFVCESPRRNLRTVKQLLFGRFFFLSLRAITEFCQWLRNVSNKSTVKAFWTRKKAAGDKVLTLGLVKRHFWWFLYHTIA